MTTRDEWLEQRRTGITGTDIASICGLNPFREAHTVWEDKLGLREADEENDAMKWGRLQEDLIAQFYSEKHGVRLIDPGRYELMRSASDPIIIGTPDRLFADDDDALLEIKTGRASTSKNWGERGTDDIPEWYYAQVQWYLGLTGRKVGIVAVKLDSADYREYSVTRNDRFITFIQQKAREFWEHYVVTRNEPRMSPRLRAETLKAMSDDGSMLAMTDPEVIQKAREYAEYNRIAKEALDKRDAARTALEGIIGEASGIEGAGFKITWKKNKDSTETDWQTIARKIAADAGIDIESEPFGALVKEHTKRKQGARVFRFKKED